MNTRIEPKTVVFLSPGSDQLGPIPCPRSIQALHPKPRRVFPAGVTCVVSQGHLRPLGPAEQSLDTDPVQGVGHQVVNPMSQHSAAQVPSPGNLFSWKNGDISEPGAHFLPAKEIAVLPRALGIISINKTMKQRGGRTSNRTKFPSCRISFRPPRGGSGIWEGAWNVVSLLTFACSRGAPGEFEFGGSSCGTPGQGQAGAGVGRHLEVGDRSQRSCRTGTTSGVS